MTKNKKIEKCPLTGIKFTIPEKPPVQKVIRVYHPGHGETPSVTIEEATKITAKTVWIWQGMRATSHPRVGIREAFFPLSMSAEAYEYATGLIKEFQIDAQHELKKAAEEMKRLEAFKARGYKLNKPRTTKNNGKKA